ncbi:TetR/AcrR family transcriptional regulator [Paraburkholderia sp. SOS3]|jgi:TetR/AcrR family transcriptional repressor of nem operon|uniref:TetR/AcrR family transcriptional regulator n=1 Tax=Paraburkholderia sp. SOS3 TaxID=1926494 RepID=UPI0009475089|nr:TetR/AcrR family transcriptional regulator [Paraburkholderia sp. SOS3]APR39894.1 TetR family transcriptional regulator [Paraburkholderia sp. SOS3]
MPRPREFDEDTVLDAAIAQFWSRGYESTSVRELADTMGITSASLYNAFGDKRALYDRALERYVERGFRDRVQRFETTLSPRDAIVAFFEEIVDLSVNDKQRRGCLIVNSVLELAPHDTAVQDALECVLKEMERFFLRCVSAGQADGTIPGHTAPADLARTLLAVLMGLRVLARVRPQRSLLEGAARPAMELIGATPKTRASSALRRPARKTSRIP